jgi:HEAT repeat protein
VFLLLLVVVDVVLAIAIVAAPVMRSCAGSPRRRHLIDPLVSIGRAPDAAEGALDAVVQLVRERSGRTQFVASWACCRLLRARPDAVSLLQHDASAAVRLVVVRAVALLQRDDRSVTMRLTPIVARALEDSDESVRRAAAAMLPPFAAAAALREILLASLTDPVAEVRQAAAHAIGSWQPPPDARTLCELLTRIDEHAGRELLIALSQSGYRAEDVAALALDGDPASRLAAIRLLGTTRSARAPQVLASLLDDPQREVRAASASAAAWLARREYPEPLDRALTDGLIALLARERASTVLAAVLDALAHSGDARVPAAVLGRIAESAESTRERLVEAAALFGHLTRWSESRADPYARA